MLLNGKNSNAEQGAAPDGVTDRERAAANGSTGKPKAGGAPKGSGQNGAPAPSSASSAEAPQTAVFLGGTARYLAWILLFLVIGLSIFLSTIIGKNSMEVMLNKQYQFASVLADNLNSQIYRRFTLPTLVGFGRIALRQPAQYERLDQLIQQVIHGLNIKELRIYDNSQTISYSTNPEVLGNSELATQDVIDAVNAVDPIFRLDSKVSTLQAVFSPKLEKESFILRTTYPLRIESRLNAAQEDGPIMGILEFTQDVTDDMIKVYDLQRSIVGIVLVSCLLIFVVLVFFLARTEKALAARIQEKQRLQEQLHQSEKLAGMGRVIAGIAHEIRNPLGIICSSAQLLLGRGRNKQDEVGQSILQAIYDEGTRLSQTVTDFLDYARPRAPREDPVNLVTVMEQVLAFLESEMRQSGISVVRSFGDAEGELTVTGDKDLLYRAIYNIMGNAVQAMAGQGEGLLYIDIHAQGESEVRLEITDSGPGFVGEELSSFLDPFFTTKPDGSGLGLPIVSSIISSHKGRLELANRAAGEDSGAVVRVILPKSK